MFMVWYRYLAPEYAQSGQVTEKADIYSFGVVLVELVTGRKAVDFNRPKGQQCLTEWVFSFSKSVAISFCKPLALMIIYIYIYFSSVTLRIIFKIDSTNICCMCEGPKQFFLFSF